MLLSRALTTLLYARPNGPHNIAHRVHIVAYIITMSMFKPLSYIVNTCIALVWGFIQLSSLRQGLISKDVVVVDDNGAGACSGVITLSNYLITNGILFLIPFFVLLMVFILQWASPYPAEQPQWRKTFFHHPSCYVALQDIRRPTGPFVLTNKTVGGVITLDLRHPQFSSMMRWYHHSAILPDLSYHRSAHRFNHNTSSRRRWLRYTSHVDWTPPRSTCAHIFGADTRFVLEHRDGVGIVDPTDIYNNPSAIVKQYGYVSVGSGGDLLGDDGSDEDNAENSEEESNHTFAHHRQQTTLKKNNTKTSSKKSITTTRPPPPITHLGSADPMEITGSQLGQFYRPMAPGYAYDQAIYSLPPPHYYKASSYQPIITTLIYLLGFIAVLWLLWLLYGSVVVLMGMMIISNGAGADVVQCNGDVLSITTQRVVVLNWFSLLVLYFNVFVLA